MCPTGWLQQPWAGGIGARSRGLEQTQPWVLNPAWEVQAETLHFILPDAWGALVGIATYLPRASALL